MKMIKYFDFKFFFRFIVLLLALYYLNRLYTDSVDKKNVIYNAFLDQHYNYVNFFRSILLHTSNFIAHLFGLHTSVEGLTKLKIAGRPSLILGLPCIGFSMMIFWIATVNAHSYDWRKKIYWTVGGIIGICLINCFRIVLMALAVEKSWNVNSFINHHDLFKLIAYSLIVGMILLYNRQYTFEKVRSLQRGEAVSA